MSTQVRSPVLRALAGLTSRPRVVLGFALLLLAAMAVAGHGVSSHLLDGGTQDPASESSRAAAILNSHFPASMPNLVLLVRPIDPVQTVNDVDVARQGVELATRLANESSVAGVTSYWPGKIASLRSTDGRYALVIAHIRGDKNQAGLAFKLIARHFGGKRGDLRVWLGGQAAVDAELRSTISADLHRAELVALPLSLLILLLAFGSVVAALLPLAVGIMAIVATDAVLRIITTFTDVSVFSQNLTTALGLGLAIDYALLIVRRFREVRQSGYESREAVVRTIDTAGRTVAFSALIVAISLSAMLLFPLYFLRSFAYAGISVVLFAALAALTVVPSALVLLGPRVEALPVRRATRGTLPGSRWRRLAGHVMRAAPFYVIGTLVVLVVVGMPFARARYGVADYRQLPASAQARVVQQIVQDDFRSKPDSVLDVLAEKPGRPSDGGPLALYAARLSRLGDVSEVSSQVGTFRHGTLVSADPVDAASSSAGFSYLSVTPAAEAISVQTQDLVRTIRRMKAPFPVLVAGGAAAVVDEQHTIGSRLGPALALIAVATLVLVFLFTGSVVIPVLTVAASALSLSVMFGAAVWAFQDGHGTGLLGFTSTGFIDISLPMLMFCVAFGLSMDYSVFLLSRIIEERNRGADNRAAIAFGVEKTGGIVTAAALILTIVLISIGTSQITNIKMLGLGVALAVLVDSFVVRCLLVPAALTLTGRATWWAPGPLRWFQQRFGLSEVTAEPVPAADRSRRRERLPR